MKLKLELEACGRSVNNGQPATLKFHPLPNLEREMQSIGASFLAAPVPGVPESANSGYFVKRSSDNNHLNTSKSDEFVGRCHTTGKLILSKSGEDGAQYTTAGQKDGSGAYEWLVVYNPKVPRSLTVNLMHNLLHESVVCAVRFNPTGSLLATGSNRSVRLFNPRTGECAAILTDPSMTGTGNEDQFFRTVAFSPDGKLLAAGAEDSIIRLWDLEHRRLLFRLSGHDSDIYSIEFYDNGTKLVSGSGDRTIKLWDLKTQECIQTLYAGTPDSAKDSGITSLSVSPNGKFLAAGSLDRLIRIWELSTGLPIDVIEGHQDSIYSIAFTADGRHLLSGSLDRIVRLWQFESEDYLKGATCKHDMIGHKDFVLSVTCSPDSRWCLTGSKDRSVQCWDRQTGNVQFALQGHKNSVIGITFSPLGGVFATASGDHRARIWTLEPTEDAPESTISDDELCQVEAKHRRLDETGEHESVDQNSHEHLAEDNSAA